MNKNKIIFSILGAILAVIIVFLIININKSTAQPTNPNTSTSSGDFTIWLYGDEASSFVDFVNEFKQDTGKYQNKNIIIESFDDYEIYTQSLQSAFLQGIGPDVFVLNNNETSTLDAQTLGIDPKFISPNDFRKVYKGVFADDLITTLETDQSIEFLKGLPVGYQALGVYYNRRFFKADVFETWTSLNSSLPDVISKKSSSKPIALGNTNIPFVPDILTQIFVSLGEKSLVDLDSNVASQGLSIFLSFGDRKTENSYNELTNYSDTTSGLEYFSRGDVNAIIGYPRLLGDIEKKGYQKNFLLATPVPQFISGKKSTLVDYNYFVINKDTQKIDMVNDLFGYLISKDGIETYLSFFPYYLPALIEVEEEILEKKINPNFNVVYKDFINRDTVLTSFNLGNRSFFESGIISVIESESNNVGLFQKLRSRIVCGVNKYTNFTNLSTSCN